jgi:hypothetical protein
MALNGNTQLKNYLHYYLGCEIWFDNKAWTSIRISKKMVRLERNKQVHNVAPSQFNEAWIKDTLPILRRLEDISDEEWNEIEDDTSITEIAKGLGYFKYAFLNGGPKDRYHWSITNEALIELRKLNVDVDGLIDAGMAIDAKTIKS